MRAFWVVSLVGVFLIFGGCAQDDGANETSDTNAAGTAGAGEAGRGDTVNSGGTVSEDEEGISGGDAGNSAAGGNEESAAGNMGSVSTGNGGSAVDEDETTAVQIGAPDGQPITITHETIISALRANITQHINEVDTAVTMVEESDMLENVLDLFFSSDDEHEHEPSDPEDPDEHDGSDLGDAVEEAASQVQEERATEEESDEGVEIDLSGVKDWLIEVLTEKLLIEADGIQNADGTTISYTVAPNPFCVDEVDEDDELSQEEIEENMRDYEECARRLTETPIVIKVSATAERKVNLVIVMGLTASEPLKLQIHDDLVAAFISADNVKSAIRLFIDEEDLAFPDSVSGTVALEARRLGTSHFATRFAVLESIRITSDEAERIKLELGESDAPGDLTLDAPNKTIEGTLNLGTIRAELPWQEVVNFLHDDEDEVEWRWQDNNDDVEDCRRVRDDCLRQCDTNDANFQNCRTACLDSVSGDVREVSESYADCIESVPETNCGADPEGNQDDGCVENFCRESNPRYGEVCDYRGWDEEIRTPAGEPAEVSGNLKVFVQAFSGTIGFDGNADSLQLSDASLGDETMTVKVESDQIIGVDVNPEHGRSFSLTASSTDNGNLSLEVAPLIDLRVALTLKHVWEAFVDEEDDLPRVLADDNLGIRFSESDAPRLETIGDDDDREMRVTAGVLTLSSPNMDTDVVISEGMCMGSIDEDTLTEEEQDAQHDLFGELIGVMCNAR